jgi:hypothetical protein
MQRRLGWSKKPHNRSRRARFSPVRVRFNRNQQRRSLHSRGHFNPKLREPASLFGSLPQRRINRAL